MGEQKSAAAKGALAAPGVVSTGSRFAGTGGGGILGPLSMLAGAYNMYQGSQDMAENGLDWGNGWDMTKGFLGMTSGAAGYTGAASTALTASAGATAGTSGVAAGFGASALGAFGAVAGAGLAGAAVGSVLNGMATSDYARDEKYGQDDWGRNRTLNDVAIDRGLAVDAWFDERGMDRMGDWAGGATAVGGAIVGMPQGVLDCIGGALFD